MPIRYQNITPPRHLAAYVRSFWILESDSESYIRRFLADAHPEMVFFYNCRFDELKSDGGAAPSFYSGIRRPAGSISRLLAKESCGVFGVSLHPFALSVFFNIPASEYADRAPSMHDILGREGGLLEERMLLARNNRERTLIISEFFTARLKQRPPEIPALFSAAQYILQTKGEERNDSVAARFFMSTRQFERKFREFSGFTPGRFSRITRPRTKG